MAAEGRVVGKKSGGGISGSSQSAEVRLDIPDVRSSFSRRIKERLGSIMNDAGESGNNQSQRPKIQKVPRKLREIESNEKCYDPEVVSFGPYHHGKDELEAMEKLKFTMARDYVKGSEKPIDDLYKKVEEVAGDARNCYAEGTTKRFDDEAFAEMMFLDGCFILQFIYCIVNNEREAIKMKNHDIAYVRRDLFLLENQLPFLVLKELMSFRFENDKGIAMIKDFIKQTRALPPNQGDSCKKRIEQFIRKCIGATQNPPELKKREFDQPVHLLELLQTQRINVDALKGVYLLSNRSGDWLSYRSAKELKAVGIHFRPCKTRYFTDVEYKSTLLSGMLTLPPITVDDSTKSMLLNLVAYETCPDAPNDYGVTSYICFLDSLIDQAEDVKELRSNGILLNLLSGGDQQVAELFNEITKGLVPNPDAYVEVKGQIERHYKNKIKLWITEWLHTHFSSPWTILAFVGAIFALSLSVTQTYYATQEK